MRAASVGFPGAGTRSTTHGGRILTGTPTIYPIWYGNHDASAIAIVTRFLLDDSGSPYFAINKTYYDGKGNVSGAFNVAGPVYDNYSQGTTIINDVVQIQEIVKAHIGQDLPLDKNGIYVVLTSPDVAVSGPYGSFGQTYCGWHEQYAGLPIIWLGDPSILAPRTCQAQSPGPNGLSGGDAMANLIAHEVEETVTDPDVSTGWYKANGEENADACAWNFAPSVPTQTAPNGAQSNLLINGSYYLIQANWINAGGGYCTMYDK